jgi:Ca-activated chloride channel family protein
MKFENIEASYLLLGILVLLIIYFLTRRQERRALERFAQKGLLSGLLSSIDFKNRRRKIVLFFTALILLIVALMRPQWGFHWEEGKRSGLDILFAIDTSRSMLAEDLKPNRLEHAKGMIRDLVKELKGDRVGLIAFSGRGFLVCPLTNDYNGFLLSVEGLDVDTLSRGGTSISSAIGEALKSYGEGEKKYKILILLSDGENHEGDPLTLMETTKQEGLRIFCIGIGTREGELIPITRDSSQKEFLKDGQGNVIKSVLNEDLLRSIALETDGGYARVNGGESVLKRIYEERLLKMEKGEFEGRMRKSYKERFQIPLAIALLLLVFETFIWERRKET